MFLYACSQYYPFILAIFLGHVWRTDKLLTTDISKGKRKKGKQQEKMLDELTKWLKVGRVRKALKAMRVRDLYKVRIAYVKEHAEHLIN